MSKALAKSRNSDAWIADLRKRFPTDQQVDKILTRKVERRRSPRSPYVPVSAAAAQEKLERFIKASVGPGCAISEVRELTGGISKEQFRFRLRTADGESPVNGEYVLRLQTPESIVETSREGEAVVLRALHGRLPVPLVPWVDDEGVHFDQPALIMGFVEGLVKPPVDGKDITGPKHAFSRRDRELVGPSFLRAIAEVHQVDCAILGNDTFSPVAGGSPEASLLQVNWWRRVWEEDSDEIVPLLSFVADWLIKNAPDTDRVSLVHGDLRAGNFIYDPTSGEIRALLDWELAHPGDRHEDLAYTMLEMFGCLDEDGQFLVNGFWPREHFIAEYERLSGLSVDPSRLMYYQIFHGFRSAVISIGTGQHVARSGLTHQDCLLAWIAATGVLALHDLIADFEKINR